MAHPMDDEEVAAFLEALTRPDRQAGHGPGRRASPRGADLVRPRPLDGRRRTRPSATSCSTPATDTVKGRNLARDPRVALCVDDDRPPFSFVIVEGTVTLSEDPGELLHWATVIGGRYMGQDQAEAYGARNGVPGELVVRLRPTRIAGHGSRSAD